MEQKQSNLINKPKVVVDALIKHFNLELRASNLYWQIATKANALGYENVGLFFVKMAQDKQQAHMLRLIDFFFKQDLAMDVLPISTPINFTDESLTAMLKEALALEKLLREHASQVCSLAQEAGDYEVFERMQWFVMDEYDDFKNIDDVLKYVEHANGDFLAIENEVHNKLERERKLPEHFYKE